MKQRKRKNLLAISGMCYLLAIGTPLYVNAATVDNPDNVITIQYVNIGSITPNLSISNGTAKCTGTVKSQGGKDCSLTVTLQKKGNNEWANIKSWSTSGKGSCSINKSYSLSKKGSYRVKATAKSGTESKTVYSKTKTY